MYPFQLAPFHQCHFLDVYWSELCFSSFPLFKGFLFKIVTFQIPHVLICNCSYVSFSLHFCVSVPLFGMVLFHKYSFHNWPFQIAGGTVSAVRLFIVLSKFILVFSIWLTNVCIIGSFGKDPTVPFRTWGMACRMVVGMLRENSIGVKDRIRFFVSGVTNIRICDWYNLKMFVSLVPSQDPHSAF